ncbi:NAD-dependent epimerase/dehydratase family protein [Lentzea sp. BCCO 10_0061]|uniref:NAD-dependent epimerase/dehydratase family protein n=1 Tax=Lentzea sokolovensis TaxID=3095429 RepID=A0ABU4URH8_9PSEU|nr:NAD-dependent epimerase/dehydratase family protein [Lentzea sp. BCCO 10_0061]MDX8142090.1 NAD-dependent epimerase/dehydratase family protein [Lentzea sp. BCCO 10_0061]
MKVFITGASGYIGKTTVAALLHHEHAVEALARTDTSAATVSEAGATPASGGLSDLDVLTSAASRADAVIHLAQADSAESDLATAMQDGVGAGTYVHTGGTWVYGDTNGIADEDAAWNPPAIVAWRKEVEDQVLSRGRSVVIRPGLLYGGQNRLIDIFFTRPGKESGAIPYIGDGTNHWSLVHVDDLANLYVVALNAQAGSVYVGVDGVDPTAHEIATALSHGASLEGKTASLSLDDARTQMGPIADAFALDQQFTPARGQTELGWTSEHTDPLAVFARG